MHTRQLLTIDGHVLDVTGLSDRNRDLLLAGVRGGDGPVTEPGAGDAAPEPEAEPTIDDILGRVAELDALTDEELVATHDDLELALDEVLAAPTDEAIALGERIVEGIETLRNSYVERAAAEQDRQDRAAALLTRVHGEASTDDGEAAPVIEAAPEAEAAAAVDDPPEPVAAAEAPASGAPPAAPESIAASSTVPRMTNIATRRPDVFRPRPRAAAPGAPLQLRATANVPGIEAGADLSRPEDLAQAFGEMIRATEGYRGPRQMLKVARLGAWQPQEVYGAERTLTRDAQENERKIAAITDFHNPEVLRASGGNCIPPQIQYDLPVLGTDARPFRDSLARFGADRGGIRTLPPPLLADVTGAVGAWTQANDISPGSDGPSTKACVTLDCPDETETLVDAITRCLKVGNFRQRFFPEQVAAWVQKIGQYHARFAETRAITQVGAGSTQVFAGDEYGTARTVLAVLDRAGARMRSYHRLPRDFPIHIAFPDWLLDNMRVDLARELPGAYSERLAVAEAELESFMRLRNFNVTWFLDGESGQIFGAQNEGSLVRWPSHVVGYMYPEGSWLFVDGGMIDFGLVRDSVTNSTNDFVMMAETLEQTHFHGYESLRLDIDICASGVTTAGADTNPCTKGS